MDAGGMANLHDVPVWTWLALAMPVLAVLVIVGVVPRWLELAGWTVGTYSVLAAALVGSILLSVRPYL